jgi:hypothetical protein
MYEKLWRPHEVWPPDDQHFMRDLIAALEGSVEEVKEMDAAGVWLHEFDGKHYILCTDSAAVAEKYHFRPSKFDGENYYISNDSVAVADRFGFAPAEDEAEDDVEED